MSGTRADIARAEAEASAARARIQETVARLRLRLDPRVRAHEAWEDLRAHGQELGDDAVEFAYERPAVAASAAGAVTLLLLRRPIFHLVRWLIRRRRARWDAPEQGTKPARWSRGRFKEGARR